MTQCSKTKVSSQAVQNALFPLIRSFTSATPAPSIYAWQFGAAAGLAVTGIFSSTPENAERDPLVRAYSDEEKLHGRQLPVTGRIIDSPGLPRMYDWELFSYVLPITGSGGKLTYITHLYYKYVFSGGPNGMWIYVDFDVADRCWNPTVLLQRAHLRSMETCSSVSSTRGLRAGVFRRSTLGLYSRCALELSISRRRRPQRSSL